MRERARWTVGVALTGAALLAVAGAYLLPRPARGQVALAVTGAPRGPSGGPTTVGNVRESGWRLAIVFRRENGRRSYLGTVANPRLPTDVLRPGPPGASAAVVADAMEYEIWLAADGRTQGLWYSSARRVYGSLTDAGSAGLASRDHGALNAIVRAARPAVAVPPPKGMAPPGVARRPRPPDTLADLCVRSQLIAVGRVVGIVRMAHTPVESATEQIQHTVSALAVEQYLKSDAPRPPAVIKVWQEGGWLPWSVLGGRARGVGFLVADDPLLIVGERYCLFLRFPEDRSGNYRRLGYIPGASAFGGHGKKAELDECFAAHYWCGKLLLRDGWTRAPGPSRDGLEHWRFKEDPQILDIPEEDAIRVIREQLARM